MKKPHPDKSAGKEIVTQWDGRDFADRLQVILENWELFWSLRLITESELQRVMTMSESAREYVIDREEKPFFESIHIKEDIDTQRNIEKLKTALRAVFL